MERKTTMVGMRRVRANIFFTWFTGPIKKHVLDPTTIISLSSSGEAREPGEAGEGAEGEEDAEAPVVSRVPQDAPLPDDEGDGGKDGEEKGGTRMERRRPRTKHATKAFTRVPQLSVTASFTFIIVLPTIAIINSGKTRSGLHRS